MVVVVISWLLQLLSGLVAVVPLPLLSLSLARSLSSSVFLSFLQLLHLHRFLVIVLFFLCAHFKHIKSSHSSESSLFHD